MMRLLRHSVWIGSLALATGLTQAQPAYEFPDFRSAAQVDSLCQRLLSAAAQHERKLQSLPPAQAPTLLSEIDGMTRRYEDTAGPLSLLAAVHPDKTIRDAAEACDLKYQAFSSAFFQNASLYQVLKQMHTVDAIDQRYQRDLLDAFLDAGVALSPVKRQQAQRISAEITRLLQAFERRIREDKTKLAFTAEQLQGVPEAVWKSNPRDRQGRYLLGLDAATYQPTIENADRPETRERYWRAYLSQGGSANLKVLARLSRLRQAYARLFGHTSYAEFALRRRMAKSPEAVQKFLDTVQTAVAQRELDDLALLRAEKALHLDQPQAVMQRWDVGYYLNRVRKARFDVDQNQFRAHFPPEASLAFVVELASRLFNLRFEAQSQTLWHGDARAFAVHDGSDGQYLGSLFLDFYPRDDKYNHAAVWSFRNASSAAGVRPAAGLVVNFSRLGLSLDELETLLHEFGHALHSLLSSTRYAAQGGTNTPLDFVEAPSQMLEDWVYDPKVLALFQAVCPACTPVSPELLDRARQARDFGKGVQVARQHLFASYDLALHGPATIDPMALWRQMESATPLGHVRGTLFPAGFAHIAGGYASGYYGYLWSLVLAEDLRTAFEGDKLSARVGQRYRRAVLARGGEVAPEHMMRDFLQRDSNSDAFFQALKGQ